MLLLVVLVNDSIVMSLLPRCRDRHRQHCVCVVVVIIVNAMTNNCIVDDGCFGDFCLG